MQDPRSPDLEPVFLVVAVLFVALLAVPITVEA